MTHTLVVPEEYFHLHCFIAGPPRMGRIYFQPPYHGSSDLKVPPHFPRLCARTESPHCSVDVVHKKFAVDLTFGYPQSVPIFAQSVAKSHRPGVYRAALQRPRILWNVALSSFVTLYVESTGGGISWEPVHSLLIPVDIIRLYP